VAAAAELRRERIREAAQRGAKIPGGYSLPARRGYNIRMLVLGSVSVAKPAPAAFMDTV